MALTIAREEQICRVRRDARAAGWRSAVLVSHLGTGLGHTELWAVLKEICSLHPPGDGQQEFHQVSRNFKGEMRIFWFGLEFTSIYISFGSVCESKAVPKY